MKETQYYFLCFDNVTYQEKIFYSDNFLVNVPGFFLFQFCRDRGRKGSQVNLKKFGLLELSLSLSELPICTFLLMMMTTSIIQYLS